MYSVSKSIRCIPGIAMFSCSLNRNQECIRSDVAYDWSSFYSILGFERTTQDGRTDLPWNPWETPQPKRHQKFSVDGGGFVGGTFFRLCILVDHHDAIKSLSILKCISRQWFSCRVFPLWNLCAAVRVSSCVEPSHVCLFGLCFSSSNCSLVTPGNTHLQSCSCFYFHCLWSMVLLWLYIYSMYE